MSKERTFSMIKPDAMRAGKQGAITQHFHDNGLRVIAQKTVWMTQQQAEGFYAVHRERPFFKDLVRFMTSGPTIVQVLEGEGAIAKNRQVMGATDSKKAEAGTIRQKFGTDIENNAVHGSDAPETAKQEIGYWFSGAELAALGL
jgi:nucleoside-diphosphate kinase